MTSPPEIDLKRLASLLDDEDENVAVSALAELINRESELGDLPAELQESSDPRVRRRAHQLQVALTLIRRRRQFAALLKAPKIDFLDGLVQIHLQWFDNDSLPGVRKKYAGFLHDFVKYPHGDLREVGEAFAALGVVALPATTLKVENYCVGTMLDERSGSTALWCGLVRELLPPDAGARVARHHGDFVVVDGDGVMLLPNRNWRTAPAPPVAELEFWDARSLLRYAATTLFSAAVNSDSFRYVLTVAQALTGCDTDEPLSALPYPYNPDLADAKLKSKR